MKRIITATLIIALIFGLAVPTASAAAPAVKNEQISEGNRHPGKGNAFRQPAPPQPNRRPVQRQPARPPVQQPHRKPQPAHRPNQHPGYRHDSRSGSGVGIGIAIGAVIGSMLTQAAYR